MILVTGTKRSGTSMWMQALAGAGLPTIGEAYSAHWEQSIKEANPRGFHEGLLRQGVFYATNPHPETGRWMHPDSVRRHVVKVFIPGLVRSDFGYLDRVVATMRNWRAYGPSLRRLEALEDAWLIEQPDGGERVRAAQENRSKLPGPVDWFLENHELIRDIAVRGYPVNLSSYGAVLRDPEAVFAKVLPWLGGGDLEGAVRAIEPSLTTQEPGEVAFEHAEVCDALYDAVDRGSPLSGGLLDELNRVREALVEAHGELSLERGQGAN